MRVLPVLFATFIFVQAQSQRPAPLPPNYKPIFENAEVLVQRVHYGPNEFVPMHDHPAVTTVYVYLNNSGIVDIHHEGGETLHRPPTRAGAFRVSPGNFERHAVQNTSDLPSDFLRIELKHLPIHSLPEQFRGDAPTEPLHSNFETVYDNPALHIERMICVPDEKCTDETARSPSLLVVVPLKSPGIPAQNPVIWLPANKAWPDRKNLKAFDGIDMPWEVLRIVLPQH